MRERIESQSRRTFIDNTCKAAAAVILAPVVSWSRDDIDPRVKVIVGRTIGVDTHNHMDVPFSKQAFDEQTYDLAGEIKLSGLRVICMTFCVDRPTLTREGEAYERFVTSLDEMDQMLKANSITRALSVKDIRKALNEKKHVIIQAVEGAHFIEGKLERVKAAYDRGLRHLGLMHDNQTTPAVGDIYTNAAEYGGLTKYGKTIIKECNRLGILVDLTHCSNAAVNDAIEVSNRPMLSSHTGLDSQLGTNERMAKMMQPRLISKHQAKIIADAGGLIGIWTHLADTPLAYAQNIRAMVEVVGVDHVCIGTDTKMAPPSSANARGGNKTNQSWQNQTDGFYYAVVAALLQTGFTEEEIGKIGGANYLKLFEAATGR